MTTKLTPPTPEQCAFIDEDARQQKTGESAAKYWVWLTPKGSKYPTSYQPTTAHPHYAKFKEWQALVDTGEVARGWWAIYNSAQIEGGFGTSGTTTELRWFPNNSYEIYKTNKHPDNCKLALKLIDWANMPVGTMTTLGGIVRSNKTLGFAHVLCLKDLSNTLNSVPNFNLRLAPQTKFTHLQDGEAPPVIDGVFIEYEYIGLNDCRYVSNKFKGLMSNKFKGLIYKHVIGYRIAGLADGWTDDPSKATS